MPATRRPALDDRRRLVIYSQRLAGEGIAQLPRPTAGGDEKRRGQTAYGSRVQRRLRARWYGLVPVKRRTLLAVATVLAAVVAVCGLLHWCALWWPPIASHPDVARPLRLDRPDSFGTWLGAVLLAACAGGSLLVYQLRRYRSDDYHGHYRIWRLTIVLALIASVDCVTGLIHWLGGTVDLLLAERDYVAGADWVRLLIGFGGAAYGLRMVGEMARNRWATAVMLASLILFAIPLAVRWNVLEIDLATAALWVPIATLAARASVLVAVMIYLRMLYREVRRMEAGDRLRDRLRRLLPTRKTPAEDLVEPKPKRRSRRTPTESPSPSRKPNREDDATDQPESESSTGDAAETASPERRGGWLKRWIPKRSARKMARAGDDTDDAPGVDQDATPITSPSTNSPSTTSASRNRGSAPTDRRESRAAVAATREAGDQNSDAQSESETDVAVPLRQRLGGVVKRLRIVGKRKTETSGDATETAASKQRDTTEPEPVRAERKSRFAGFRRKAAATEQPLATEADDGPPKRRWWQIKGRSAGDAAAADNADEGGDRGGSNSSSSARSSASAGPRPQRSGASDRPQSVASAGNDEQRRVVSQNASAGNPAASHDNDLDDDDDSQDDQDLDPDSVDWGSLNKSERRRMRKIMKRQGKAA
jgi:hypothetical protein